MFVSKDFTSTTRLEVINPICAVEVVAEDHVTGHKRRKIDVELD